MMKNDLKVCHRNLTEEQNVMQELKRIRDTKGIEAEKLKNDGLYYYAEHEKLLQENFRLKTQYENGVSDNRRVQATKIDIDSRLKEFNNKISEVTLYLATLREDEKILH